MLVYKIDVIDYLKNKGYNSTIILRDNILSQSTMQKLRKGEIVGAKALDQICRLLDMQPGDIIRFISDNDPSS